jgi:hypothetical protein
LSHRLQYIVIVQHRASAMVWYLYTTLRQTIVALAIESHLQHNRKFLVRKNCMKEIHNRSMCILNVFEKQLRTSSNMHRIITSLVIIPRFSNK